MGMFGYLNLDKPAGVTSRDCVNMVQRLTRRTKVGHCGTLDPLATGVLVVCVGPATRLTQYVQDLPKTYLGRFRLGFESDTEDTESELRPVEDAAEVTREGLLEALPNFLGTIEQLPPRFSALRIRGKRAYELARQGREVELKARPVRIDALNLVEFDEDSFSLEMTCGSGTYVRSLGRDLARSVGSGAVMTALQRTAIGPFAIQDAISPEVLTRDNLAAHLIAPQFGLTAFRQIPVTTSQAEGFVFGNPMEVTEDMDLEFHQGLAAAIDPEGRMVALVQRKGSRHLTPKVNFSQHWYKG